jgi:membrane fusion protein (multidrug efflux system)
MNTLLKHKLLASSAICLTVIVLLVAVVRSGKSEEHVRAAPPPGVEVARVEQRDVPIYSEWVGTLDGMVNAEIRAQVAGYLLKQHYAEGSVVKKGQLLFEIDPRPSQAALAEARGRLAQAQGQLAQTNSQLLQAEAQLAQANSQVLQAEAQLAQAEANQGKTRLDVERYTPLAKEKAVTDQELDNAVQADRAAAAQVRAAAAGVETAKAQVRAAKAQVETAKAAIVTAQSAVETANAEVNTAQINLGFTRIVSPIDGIAGIAQAQVGDLVNPNSGALTTVSTVNPVKAYFTLSEQEYLNFTRRNPTQREWDAANRSLELELILADGTTYPERGRFFVADRQVDEKTGAIRLAGIFPNPGNTLRPGQYGRVRAVTSTREGALLVPQRAVTELQGGYQVAVVGADNKVSIRAVKVGERVETMWVIEDGLEAGETVVAEGTQKVRPDAVVNPKPFVAPQPAQ